MALANTPKDNDTFSETTRDNNDSTSSQITKTHNDINKEDTDITLKDDVYGR